MSLKQEFLDSLGDNYPGAKNGTFRTGWNKVLRIEAETGLDLSKMSRREEYIEFATHMNFRKQIRFTPEMSAIRLYITFLVERGIVPTTALEEFSSIKFADIPVKEGGAFYYKDISSLRTEIEHAITNASATNIDTSVFYGATCAIYLAWYGVTVQEMCEIKKRDILDDRIIVDGRVLSLPRFVMDVLKAYKEADGYYQQAKGVIYKRYTDSEYLFRSVANDKLTPKRITGLVVKLNTTSRDGHELQLKMVHWSGLFHRAYIEETVDKTFDPNNTTIDELRRLFGTEGDASSDRARKSRLLSDYRKYKTMFEE